MPPDVCLHSEDPDIEICKWIMGDTTEPSRGGFNCFTGIDFAGGGNVSTGCRNCDTGCVQCMDDLDVAMGNWADDQDGDSYVRAARSATAYRNAQNQRQDIRSVQRANTSRKAAMFLDEITLEHSACINNNGDSVCWDAQGHPCNCTTRPVSDVVPPIRPIGFFRDTIFYNRTGWPMDYPDMYCRRWNDVPRTHRFTVRSDNGQTQFVAMGPASECQTNSLVMCAGKIPTSMCLDCSNSRDGSPEGGGAPVAPTYQIQDAEQRQFDRLIIRTNAAELRHDDGIRNEVLAMVTTVEFPDPIEGQPDRTINFAQLDHQLLGSGNSALGNYGRGWTAQSIEDAVHVKDLDARLRWGTCDVAAELVITSVQFHSNVKLHRTRQKHLGSSPSHYVNPYVVVNLEVTLAVRAELVGEPCTVGGEPVTLTFDSGRLTPTVTPAGNAVIYTDRAGKPIHVHQTVQWLGRLNQHSFPKTPLIRMDTPDDPDWRKCTAIRTKVGRMHVPGLLGRFFNEDDQLPLRSVPRDPPRSLAGRRRPPDGDDANIVYGGFMELEFQDL